MSGRKALLDLCQRAAIEVESASLAAEIAIESNCLEALLFHLEEARRAVELLQLGLSHIRASDEDA